MMVVTEPWNSNVWQVESGLLRFATYDTDLGVE